MRRAAELGRAAGGSAPARDPETDAAELLSAAGGDRRLVQQARDAYARRLHGNSSDFEATAALRVLNPALSALGWEDPYSWKHRRKP